MTIGVTGISNDNGRDGVIEDGPVRRFRQLIGAMAATVAPAA